MNFKAPIKVICKGNKEIASQFIGISKSRISILENAMSFQKLKQYSLLPWKPEKGVMVEIMKVFGVITIVITASRIAGKREKEELSTSTSLRFFCRVGKYTDIEPDNTRYYWIDFGALSGIDEVNVYPIKNVSAALLEHAVDTPTDHAQVKSFSLSRIDRNDETVYRRFVAGYHYLVEDLGSGPEENTGGGRRLLAADMTAGEELAAIGGPDVVHLSQASCEDGTGTNRFYANIDEGMIAWYRVLQEWPAGTPVLTEADGQIDGYFSRIGYDNDAGRWGIYNESFLHFRLSPINLIGSDVDMGHTLREPVCLFTDIYELTTTSFKVNIPYEHRPILVNMYTGELEYPDELYCFEFSADGFEQRLATTYEYSSGKISENKATKAETIEYVYKAGLCSGHLTQDECEDYADTHNQYYSNWWTIYTVTDNLSTVTAIPYHGSYIYFSGRKSEEFYSRISELWSQCAWYPISGTCGDPAVFTHPCKPLKRTYWILLGSGTNKFFGKTFGNNIHFGDKSTDTHNWTFNDRHLSCSDDVLIESHTNCSPGSGASLNLYDNLGLWFSKLNSGTPNYCERTDGNPSLHASAESEWPGNGHEIDESCRNPLPGGSSLSYGSRRYEADDSGSDSSTTELDSYIVDDDSTYSQSSVGSIRYLDDRSAENTHGLCIAVKGNSLGSWVSVVHGEDGITATARDKYPEIRQSLVDRGYLSDVDDIIDIGLI